MSNRYAIAPAVAALPNARGIDTFAIHASFPSAPRCVARISPHATSPAAMDKLAWKQIRKAARRKLITILALLSVLGLTATTAFAVSPLRVRLTAFALAGALAGVGGGLYVIALKGLPFSGFPPQLSRPDTSGLVREVTPGKEHVFEFGVEVPN